MKLYVDDIRSAPDGWILAKTYEEIVDYILTKEVTHISLDYDAEFADGNSVKGYYYDVMRMFIDCAKENQFEYIPIFYKFHTANADGRRMLKHGFFLLQELVPFEIKMIL